MKTLPNTFREMVGNIELTSVTFELTGVTFEAKNKIEVLEAYPEPGMRFNLKGVRVLPYYNVDETPPNGTMIELVLDAEAWRSYNQKFEKPDYYGRDNIPNKTATEAGFYEKRLSVYVMINENPNEYFSIVDDPAAKVKADIMEALEGYSNDALHEILAYIKEG